MHRPLEKSSNSHLHRILNAPLILVVLCEHVFGCTQHTLYRLCTKLRICRILHGHNLVIEDLVRFLRKATDLVMLLDICVLTRRAFLLISFLNEVRNTFKATIIAVFVLAAPLRQAPAMTDDFCFSFSSSVSSSSSIFIRAFMILSTFAFFSGLSLSLSLIRACFPGMGLPSTDSSKLLSRSALFSSQAC